MKSLKEMYMERALSADPGGAGRRYFESNEQSFMAGAAAMAELFASHEDKVYLCAEVALAPKMTYESWCRDFMCINRGQDMIIVRISKRLAPAQQPENSSDD